MVFSWKSFALSVSRPSTRIKKSTITICILQMVMVLFLQTNQIKLIVAYRFRWKECERPVWEILKSLKQQTTSEKLSWWQSFYLFSFVAIMPQKNIWNMGSMVHSSLPGMYSCMYLIGRHDTLLDGVALPGTSLNFLAFCCCITVLRSSWTCLRLTGVQIKFSL